MSFEQYLDNLRARPVAARKRIAFWYSFGITAIIFVFWLTSFTTISGNSDSDIAKTVNNATTPTQSLIAGVGSLFTDIKDIVFSPKKINYKSIEIGPGDR